MPIEQRIRMCLLIERMHEYKTYSERLGLVDVSKFHGKIMKEEKKKRC